MRIGIVSYYAPPQKAVASHRVLRMTRALLAAGHEVHWITADTTGMVDLDASLRSLVPSKVVQHPLSGQALVTKPVAANFCEKILRSLAFSLPRYFPLPDGFLAWAWALRRKLPKILRANQIEAVLLCCSPHTQILSLPQLRRKLPELAIYVDYRDLCTGNPWNRKGDQAWEDRLCRLERRMLAHCDALFVNSEQARQAFLDTVGPIAGVTVQVMRNTADYAVAAELAEQSPLPDLAEGCHLGFFGTLFPRRRLWPLLAALQQMPAEERRQIQLHVYCDAGDSAKLLAEDCGKLDADLAAQVHRYDYLPYAQALRTMQAMDALVLINGAEAQDAIFIPGKIYDYFMARRPILFMGHPGEARNLVAEAYGQEWVFQHGDGAGVAACLGSLLRRSIPAMPVQESFQPGMTFAPLLQLLEFHK